MPRNLLRSEEHTSELQSRAQISYAVFCLKKKTARLRGKRRPRARRRCRPRVGRPPSRSPAFFFLMIRPPPRSTLELTLFPYTTLFRSLFVSRILCGIAAASVSTAHAYIADTTDDTNRSAGMALIGMAFGLGIVLGPPIGGILSGFFSSPNLLPGAVAAGLSVIAFTMAAFALPESNPRGAQPGRWTLLDHESWMIFFRIRGLRLAGA